MSRGGSTRAWRQLRQRVLQRDGHVCNYCGDVATHVDHIIPVAAGGTDSMDNLTAACARCNQKKSDNVGIFLSTGHPTPRPLCSLSPMLRFDPPTNGTAP